MIEYADGFKLISLHQSLFKSLRVVGEEDQVIAKHGNRRNFKNCQIRSENTKNPYMLDILLECCGASQIPHHHSMIMSHYKSQSLFLTFIFWL